MSILEKLSSAQNVRDEGPNIALAQELVERADTQGVKEVAENLWHSDKNIQSDCASVIEQVGLLDPKLIAAHVSDYIKLLSSKNNRLVWGGMIALALVADIRPKEIFDNLDVVYKAVKKGSVITRDNGIRTLGKVASVDQTYNEAIFPFLIEHLKNCRSKDIPQHAESILVAVKFPGNEQVYRDVLNERIDELKPSQHSRVKKIFRSLDAA
jgi:hypothetical protein